MKKKIILTEKQYFNLSKFLFENINNDFKYIKNGDILTFTLKNNQNVNLKITSVNLSNNEILAYGPKNEKILLRIGDFNDSDDTLKYYQFDDTLKKYMSKKVVVKDMKIWRNNELFTPSSDGVNNQPNNQPNNEPINPQPQQPNSNLDNLEIDDVIIFNDRRGNDYSITIDSITDNEVYGINQNGNEIILKDIDYEKKIISFIANDNKGYVQKINFVNLKISKNEDKEPVETENDELFRQYYKEIINDPNLKKAFYTAPSLWNYFVSALKDKKARGSGIYPAYEIINNYYTKRINDKLPGFTNKENKRATFYLLDNVKIPYLDFKGNEKEFNMVPREYKATVKQYEAGLGDVKILSYKEAGGNFGFKLAVKEPTGLKQDEYYCDIYVNNNKTEDDKYLQKNIRVKFINSDGYTSYDNLKNS